MMSVFCSNTLIKFFWGGGRGALSPTPLETCAFGARKSHLKHEVFPSPLPPKLLPPT